MKINEEKMFYDIADGQAIVINYLTGMYYGMSSLGSAVLDLILKGISPAGIADEIRKKDGCPEEIGEKIDAFIKTLLEEEILIGSPDDEGTGEPAVIGDEAYADGFELTVDAYAEAQDLILADPVHEVDVSVQTNDLPVGVFKKTFVHEVIPGRIRIVSLI